MSGGYQCDNCRAYLSEAQCVTHSCSVDWKARAEAAEKRAKDRLQEAAKQQEYFYEANGLAVKAMAERDEARNALMLERGNAEYLTRTRDEARAQVAALRDLLRPVTEMAGTPDLFAPDGGWDEWLTRAERALAAPHVDEPEPVRATPEMFQHLEDVMAKSKRSVTEAKALTASLGLSDEPEPLDDSDYVHPGSGRLRHSKPGTGYVTFEAVKPAPKPDPEFHSWLSRAKKEIEKERAGWEENFRALGWLSPEQVARVRECVVLMQRATGGVTDFADKPYTEALRILDGKKDA